MDKQAQYTRWDAVVPVAMSRATGKPPATNVDAPAPGTEVTIHVCLYGGLAPVAIERPICLTLKAPLTLRDVIVALQQRLDGWPTDLIFNSPGELSRRCRLFVDGVSAQKLDAVIGTSTHSTQVEMILLTANEGG